MRAMTLDRIAPPLKLGRTLYAGDGRVLLHRGTELSDEYLGHLREMGFEALYVDDPREPSDVAAVDLVSENTRIEAQSAVKEAFGHMLEQRGQKFVHDWSGRRALYVAASSITNEVMASKDLCFQMAELRSNDGYTFAHSVNVSILGMALARKLQVPHSQLVDLAIGLMLHDIGKLVLPENLRDPDRQLTEEEQAEYERHAKGGYALLQTMGSSFTAPTKIVSLQHHERWDGTGYPKGLKGDEIHLFAQICAVADTYDRLITSKAYGFKALPHEALEYLMGSCDRHFSLEIVRAFLEIVAPYPLGTTVRLNTGEEGMVVRIDKGKHSRPVLRLFDEDRRLRSEDFELYAHTDRVIVQVTNG
jgi:HD-GYP domain-containing protein (c-di-GMP phosphodiesterase class II)